MSPEKKPPAVRKKPKPRIPLPPKPGRVIEDEGIYKRKPKHRKQGEESP
jgi:hypothetical protein